MLWSEEGTGKDFKGDEVGAGHPRMHSRSTGQAEEGKGNVEGRKNTCKGTEVCPSFRS